MGVDALQGNGITRKILYFFRDKALTPMDEPLRRVRKSRIILFVAVQLIGLGATMAITQTIGTPEFYRHLNMLIFVLNRNRSCHRFPYHHLPVGTGPYVVDSTAAFYRRRARDTRRTHGVAFRK